VPGSPVESKGLAWRRLDECRNVPRPPAELQTPSQPKRAAGEMINEVEEGENQKAPTALVLLRYFRQALLTVDRTRIYSLDLSSETKQQRGRKKRKSRNFVLVSPPPPRFLLLLLYLLLPSPFPSQLTLNRLESRLLREGEKRRQNRGMGRRGSVRSEESRNREKGDARGGCCKESRRKRMRRERKWKEKKGSATPSAMVPPYGSAISK
jgi:hypothetical protein